MSTEPACMRPNCGHTEAEHQSDLGWCDECMCQGFLSEETFGPAGEEVEELYLGEDGS